ncbi:MAG TPA: VWA domain-containing protein [Blastocatellia bacterium]|nr:VWA domain-containing protein [Blastocatellia bacterium]
MSIHHRFYCKAACLLVSGATILMVCPASFTQAPQGERSFPTQDNPKVVISNASTVAIQSWDKNAVSISAGVAAAPVKIEEVLITQEKDTLSVSCHPVEPNRRIMLTVQVPRKAVLEIKSDGNTVQVNEPAGRITVTLASKDLINLDAPGYTVISTSGVSFMKVTPKRVSRDDEDLRPYGNRSAVIVKMTAPKAMVLATLKSYEPAKKPLTLAAQTIARRAGLMGEALRRTNPQLLRPQRDQTEPVSPTDSEEGALKLETHLINLNIGATDRTGRPIADLKPGDFNVYEDGVPQRISFFSPEQSPFNLVLLIDVSGSMKDDIELIKETAMHFLDVIRPQDSVGFVTFTTDVTVVSHLTKDRDDVRKNVERMLAPKGGTAFYDALGYSLVEILRKVRGQRNAVIAISDGEDNALLAQLTGSPRSVGVAPKAGSFLTFDELLDGAKETDAIIYPIHLDPAPPQLAVQPNLRPPADTSARALEIQTATTQIAKKQLLMLAEASGGRFYHANRIEDLKGVFEQVAAELRTVYSMAYTTTNLKFDGRFRRILVQANRPDVVIRTRPGYYGR